MIYEKYVDGVRVSREQPEPDKFDDTRIGSAVLDRRSSGARDGWYVEGEWVKEEAKRTAAIKPTVKPKGKTSAFIEHKVVPS
jgi:hypothetical protein